MNTDTARTAEVATFTKTIWVSHIEVFKKKISHLNKILAKNGKPEISYKFENYRLVPVDFEYHQKGDAFANDTIKTRNIEMCDAVCTGYTFVKRNDIELEYLGTVSFQDGVKQVFCKNEKYGRFFMDDFRSNYCDHCHTTRTNRKTYYLFLNPKTDLVVQIGSSCAKEYFGIDSDAFLTAYGRTFLVDYCGDESCLGYDGGVEGFSYGDVAQALDYCTNGFLKWNKKGEFFPMLPIWDNPTVEGLESLLRSTEPLPERGNFFLLPYEECLAFWEAKYAKEGSTFAYNCLNALRAKYAVKRSMGAFAYAIFKAYNAKVEALREAEAAKKEYVPCAYPVNSRQNIKGTVTNIREFIDEEFRGIFTYRPEMTKYIVDFTEDNGTLYHFTTSGSSFSELCMGDRIEMRCTIGETKPFKGVPYTRVSRPKATKLAV